jgi:FHS family L-fucose permease-like MFS transporter
MFYVGAQIMVWTFIIQYAENELGMDNATAANHQIVALVIFLAFRFICTAFLRYVSPGKLLAILALFGVAFTLGAIHLQGMTGLYSLILISACMSLMFPTIYGIALEGIGQDAKLGSAGLILAIVGAVWLTGFQGRILDLESFMGTTATRGSFYLSVGCFIIIAIYGLFCRNPRSKPSAA